MKRPQLLLLMLFVTLIAVFIYADNSHNSQLNFVKKMDRCKNQLGCWQEMIKEKLPF